ncbi:MAG: hypothetical protein WKG00_25180 [Polyangiaceae bacterium]
MTPLTAIVVALCVGLLALHLVRTFLLGYPPPSLPAGAHLNRREQALVAAAADALFPAGGPIAISGSGAGLVAYTDAYVGRMHAASRALIGLLFVFLEHAPWVFGPTRRRFTRLSPAQRMAALARMATSPIYFRRVAFLSLRTILSMGYLAHPVVARRIGMLGPEDPETAAQLEASTGATSPDGASSEAEREAPTRSGSRPRVDIPAGVESGKAGAA